MEQNIRNYQFDGWVEFLERLYTKIPKSVAKKIILTQLSYFVDIGMILRKPDLNYDWDILTLSNGHIRPEDILDHPDLPWKNVSKLSSHINLTIDTIIKHPANPWNGWDEFSVSKHKNITLIDIKNNQQFPWSSQGLKLNPNLTEPEYEEYINGGGRHVDDYARRMLVDYHFVTNLERMNFYHPSEHLVWSTRGFDLFFKDDETVEAKPIKKPKPMILDWKYIKNRPRSYDWDELSSNKTLLWKDILDNIHLPWNMKCIVGNTFDTQLEHYRAKYIVECNRVTRIQQWWFVYKHSPSNLVGMRRMYCEFYEDNPEYVSRIKSCRSVQDITNFVDSIDGL